MKLVALESDPNHQWSLTRTLRQAGYHCRGYQTVHALMESPWAEEADLAIIDGDGVHLDMRLIERLRQRFWSDRPMLFIGSRDYQFGHIARDGDGRLVRPISASSLLKCVRATLGRAWDRYANLDTVRFGQYLFEPHGRSVLINGARVALTRKEYSLALLLFRNLSRPVSRVYIAGCVWRHDERINTRTMTTHISAIRAKLRFRENADYVLIPIYNYGYRLDPAIRYPLMSDERNGDSPGPMLTDECQVDSGLSVESTS
ncbi:response regulator transcription factor [Paraburkholderia aspalathi]|uniref:DNA-binding response regulator, OmpR family, contains REC and winged-helix (WHTH) domain n=1 Tax=Paraburkholderia aspalathi TaxID=1324617 RepID=A0A1I7ERL9_9BURK|nr:response regulator transcription factor [Paraburkholderia aspalathi]SFU26556.1 DNA-binding response regulator, OmpR family, contains REC and winged-helix (wHTH) domain [Paraburkholderia aspalathi]